MNALSDFGLKGASIELKRCSTNGMTRRLSSTRSARMTGISTFFDNKHQHPMGSGNWFRFAAQDRQEVSLSATASEPHLPPVECKIENANKDARSRQNGCGDVGIDQFVQVMHQESSLVRRDSGFGFEPVL